MNLIDNFYYNDNAKDIIINMVNGKHLPNCILIEGETGTGKKLFAKIISQMALCTGDKKPCGVCLHCSKIQKDIHPDVKIIKPDGKNGSYSIKLSRQIRTDAYILPNEASRVVFIIPDIHNMSELAQNAMLKVIEEPPNNAMFIFTCTNRAKILETILSRATIIRINSTTMLQCREVIGKIIPNKTEKEYADACKIADGNIGIAKEILLNNKNLQLYEDAKDIIEKLVTGKQYEACKVLYKYESKRENFICLLKYLKDIFSDIFINQNTHDNDDQFVKDISLAITKLHCIKIIDIIDKMNILIKHNVNTALLISKLSSNIKSVLVNIK